MFIFPKHKYLSSSSEYFRNKVVLLKTKIFSDNITPKAISMGFALGVFISVLPLIGFQTVIIIAVASIMKWNKAAALAGSFVNNPVTFLPMYAFNYWVGTKLTHTGIAGIQELKKVLLNFSFKEFAAMGADIMLPLWVGSALVAVVAAAVGYAACFLFSKKYLKNIENKNFKV